MSSLRNRPSLILFDVRTPLSFLTVTPGPPALVCCNLMRFLWCNVFTVSSVAQKTPSFLLFFHRHIFIRTFQVDVTLDDDLRPILEGNVFRAREVHQRGLHLSSRARTVALLRKERSGSTALCFSAPAGLKRLKVTPDSSVPQESPASVSYC